MSPRRLETGRISQVELWSLLVGFMIGNTVLLPPGLLAEHDAWAAVLAGMVGSLAVALIYLKLARRFSGKTLVGICREVYGRFAGTLISLAFIGYLLHLASLVMTYFADYFTATSYRLTPPAGGNAASALVVILAVTGGIEVLARTSTAIIAPVLAVFLADGFVALSRANPLNLLPLFDVRPAAFAWAALGSLTFPFAESVAFLMIFPVVAGERRLARTVLGAIVTVGAIYTAVALRNAAVLGNALRFFVYSSIEVVRLVNIGNVLSRVEIVIVAVLVGSAFIKIAVLVYGGALGLAEVCNLRTYRPLVHPVIALVVLLAEYNFRSVPESVRFMTVTYPVYGLIFQLVLPAATLLVAMARRLPRRQSGPGPQASER